MRQNPYNVFRPQGVPNGKIQILPQNYAFDLTMETWWSAVQRAKLYSDFTGLDALYSYALKSSTIIRSAVEKRLRPLKSRTFSVHINGEEDKRLTELLADSPLMRSLIYERGLSNFTYARVVGVERDLSTYVYPLRNLDIVNKSVKNYTYDVQGSVNVKTHVNLFWMQASYDSEETLGLLEPICRDYINMSNAQNNWQTASQFLAYQQMMLYYENGDSKMREAAETAAGQVGLGTVIISGKVTDENSGKVQKDLELENVYGSATADTFRIFKENIEQLRGAIMQLVLGSSLLGMSDKNTNSERLVRAHLKLFKDIVESDAVDVQDWLNIEDNKRKIAYLLNEPSLADATFKTKPINYIDVGDLETYTNMIADLGLKVEEGFIKKAGLEESDVSGYGDQIENVNTEDNGEEIEDTDTGGERLAELSTKEVTRRSFPRMVVDFAKRVLNRNRPSNG